MPKHIKSSITASNATFSFSFMALLVWLVVSQGAIAEIIPDDVLELRRGGYAFADYPGVFDDIDGEGITLEAWIYLTDLPKDIHVRKAGWVIIAKPGSYEVLSHGRNLSSGLDQILPEGTVWVSVRIWKQPRPGGGRAWSSVGRQFLPGDFPLERWAHIALQIAGDEFATQWNPFFDRQRLLKGSMGEAMGRTAEPLLIGGSKFVTSKGGSVWGEGYESMQGFFDEVRVSKGYRYPEGVGILPRRRFRADARTIALWHFDEGPGALRYADASGNGYTLFAGGSLAVDARGKLATTWGSLKRENSYTNP